MKTFQKILVVLIVQLFCIQQNIFAQDTLSVVKPAKHKFKAESMKATMMAVAFPGLGQIYNRKYWKIPLVYGGFGALIYSVGFNSSSYNKYMQYYLDFTDTNPNTKSYQEVITSDPSTYDPVLYPSSHNPTIASSYKDQMLRMVDYYKRYRDLSYIGIAGWYLISILDANVDASLFNYDVSPNLDLAVVPIMLSLPGGFTGTGLNVSLKLNF